MIRVSFLPKAPPPEIKRVLGRGAFGIVLEAFDLPHLWNVYRKKNNIESKATVGQVANEARVTQASVELQPLVNQNSIGDGRIEDVTFDADVMTLDGTDRSPNLWLNFFNVVGDELTLRTKFRVLSPVKPGFAKLVFMTDGDPEVYALIGNWQGKTTGWIESSESRHREAEGVPLPSVGNDEWTDLRFVVSHNEFSLYANDEFVTRFPRKRLRPGYVAIGSGGWRCQLKFARVILSGESQGTPAQNSNPVPRTNGRPQGGLK